MLSRRLQRFCRPSNATTWVLFPFVLDHLRVRCFKLKIYPSCGMQSGASEKSRLLTATAKGSRALGQYGPLRSATFLTAGLSSRGVRNARRSVISGQTGSCLARSWIRGTRGAVTRCFELGNGRLRTARTTESASVARITIHRKLISAPIPKAPISLPQGQSLLQAKNRENSLTNPRTRVARRVYYSAGTKYRPFLCGARGC